MPLSVSPHMNCLHKCHQISKNCIWVSPIHLIRLPVWVKTKTCNGAFWVLECWFCLTIHQRQLSRVSETKNFVSNFWSLELKFKPWLNHMPCQVSSDYKGFIHLLIYIYTERETLQYICIHMYIYVYMLKWKRSIQRKTQFTLFWKAVSATSTSVFS